MYKTLLSLELENKETLLVIEPQLTVRAIRPVRIVLLVNNHNVGFRILGAGILDPEITNLPGALNVVAGAYRDGNLHNAAVFVSNWVVRNPYILRVRNYREVDPSHIDRLIGLVYCNKIGATWHVTLDGLPIVSGEFNKADELNNTVRNKLIELETYRLYRLLNTQDGQWNQSYAQARATGDPRHALANDCIRIDSNYDNVAMTLIIQLGLDHADNFIKYDFLKPVIALAPTELVRSFIATLPTYMEHNIVGIKNENS